jgi:hypothetical protein
LTSNENVSHQPTRRREHKKQGFISVGSAQRFLSVHAAAQNTFFSVQRHLTSARTRRSFSASARQTWRDDSAGRPQWAQAQNCVPSAFGETREFDPWGRRGPVEGPRRFKIAASTFLDRKIIQET